MKKQRNIKNQTLFACLNIALELFFEKILTKSGFNLSIQCRHSLYLEYKSFKRLTNEYSTIVAYIISYKIFKYGVYSKNENSKTNKSSKASINSSLS